MSADYAQIIPAARDSFARAMMEMQQAARSFSGNFTTPAARQSASDSLARAEQSLRDTRKAMK